VIGPTAARRRAAAPARRPAAVAVHVLAALIAAVIVCAAVSARAEDGPPSVVAVLGFHGSRLADEIKRELESSRFEVLSAELGARRWQDAAREVDAGRLTRGVAIDAEDRTLTVYTRVAGQAGVTVRLVLSVNPGDRMARRHACVSAVELLHALSENEGEPALDPPGLRNGTSVRGAAPASPGSRPSTTPGEKARPGDTASAGGAAATGGALPRPSVARATNAGPIPSAVPDGPGSSGSSAALDLNLAPRESGWQLGAGATFGVETNGGGPTSHLQFIGRIQATPHLALCARALWPLLATEGRNGGDDFRAWSFGVGVSPQYTFSPRRRLRPYVGLGPGARLGITETSLMGALQSQVVFTFSVTLGIEAGVRYALSPLVQVFFELASARAWLLPPHEATDSGRAAANGESARATVGVLFES
jgi:outer membrane protein with beta-barrel domain